MNTVNTSNEADREARSQTEQHSITGSELDWTKPGPGSWQLDGSHFEADCSRLAQEVIATGMTEGMAQGFARMGAPLKGLEARFVNGNFYYRLVPLIAGNKDLPLPPNPVLWLLTRIHPAFRRQEKLAKSSIEGRVWNEELARWEATDKPYLIEQCRASAAKDPAAMTDPELVAHIEKSIELVFHGSILHFRLHVSDLGPIGLLLVRTRDWGLDTVAVMSTLAGSSPATSAPKAALAAIGRAAGPGPHQTLDQVRAASPEAAKLLDGFLAEYGWRLTTGYDLQELTLAELPELVISGINGAEQASDRNGAHESTGADTAARRAGAAAFDKLEEQLAPENRSEFERLVSDARALYGLRDENGPLTYQWPAGLLRRAMLEAAKRLHAAGRIGDEEQIFDLGSQELIGLLKGAATPTPEILAARLQERRLWKQHRAPALLGPEPDEPPPWTLPPSLAKIMDVVLTVMELIESDGTTPTLDGIGIGSEPHVGRARVVADEIDALSRMEPGDVLIAPFTVPTYNAVLAIAGAVVVENGGLLCHAAVIAREYGIPGLVGVTGVTGQITDGAMVRVDPTAGTVREIQPD